MNLIFRFTIALMLLFGIHGCGNGGGSSKTLLKITKVEPINSSVLSGKELNISLEIESTKNIDNIPIGFNIVTLKNEDNKSAIDKQLEIGSTGINIKSGVNNYNIQFITLTDINESGEYYIGAQIDPLDILEDVISEKNLYLSENKIEVIKNSQPDIRLLKVDIDKNIQDGELFSTILNDKNTSDLNKTHFLNYGVFKTFSGDNLLAINDKNLTVSGTLSILPLVKDMNHTEITACIKLDGECIPLQFRINDDKNQTLLMDKKEVDLSINHSVNIAFELFIDTDTLNLITKKLFKMKRGDALNADIQFKLENSDYGFEKEFIRTLAIQTNRLLENYIDTEYDPIYIASQYYSNPIVMGGEDNAIQQLNDIIVLSADEVSNDYTENSSNQKIKLDNSLYQKDYSCTYTDLNRYRDKECEKYLARNSKRFGFDFSKNASDGEGYFGANLSLYGGATLDYHGVKAKVSGDTSLTILKHKVNIFNIDSIAKIDPISFKSTGYSTTLKIINFNIYSSNNDLYKKTGLRNSSATDLKKKIKENQDRINQRYSRQEQHSLINFSGNISFGLSEIIDKKSNIKLEYTQTMFVGPVPVNFTAEVNPTIGIKPSIGLDGITGIKANVTPYISTNVTLSVGTGIRDKAEIKVEGVLTLIEDDFITQTSGKLDLLNKDGKTDTIKGQVTETIKNKVFGPSGEIDAIAVVKVGAWGHYVNVEKRYPLVDFEAPYAKTNTLLKKRVSGFKVNIP